MLIIVDILHQHPIKTRYFSFTMFIMSFVLLGLGGYQSFSKNPILVFNREKKSGLYLAQKIRYLLPAILKLVSVKLVKHFTFQLFGLDKSKQTLVSELFFPNVYVYSVYNTSTDYHDQRFINFINTYMREGRDAIIPFPIITVKNPKVYFWQNPPPADFEQQVEQILAKLDQEKRTPCVVW